MSLDFVATSSKMSRDRFPMLENMFNPGARKRPIDIYIYIDTLNLRSGVQKMKFLGIGSFSTEQPGLYCLVFKHDDGTYPIFGSL